MKMSVTLSLPFSLFLVIHTASAFNITKILEEYPDYSTFNSYLTQTGLAGDINGRKTLTILAVDNGNLSPLSGKPLPVLKDIMSVHVVLDYYDVPKLTNLTNNSATLTTLYQSSGHAADHTGFLNVTKQGSSIVFGSAKPGSPLGSNLVKVVAAQPYDILVIQVSSVIVPEGIDTAKTSPPPKASPPAPAARPSRAPAPSRKAGPPPKANDSSPAPMPDAPTADAPTADSPPADKTPSPGAGTALHVGPAVVLTMVLSTLYLASRF